MDLSPEPRAHAHSSGGLSPAGLNSSRLVKSSSDPSIATVEEGAPGYSAPPPYSPASSYNKQVRVSKLSSVPILFLLGLEKSLPVAFTANLR